MKQSKLYRRNQNKIKHIFYNNGFKIRTKLVLRNSLLRIPILLYKVGGFVQNFKVSENMNFGEKLSSI